MSIEWAVPARCATSSTLARLVTGRALMFFHEIKLEFLDFEEALPHVLGEMVDLLVELSDFELRFEIDLVVVFAAQPIFCVLPVLTHHDDRRLDRGDAGEHEVAERIRNEVGRVLALDPRP